MTTMHKCVPLLLLSFFFSSPVFCQTDLPSEMRITEDGRLVSGGNDDQGFYKIDQVNKLELLLEEPNWFSILDENTGASLIGQLRFNDELLLDSVLISIKGQTSDRRNDTEKKSFSIKIDDYIDQDLMGYDNINLNCAFDDESGMREVLFYDISKDFTTALKGNFIDLYINGQSWGPYNNIQQIEGTYIKQWFSNNEGTRWRANGGMRGGGPGGPGGGSMFGAGLNSLNYNGPDSLDYVDSYELKKTSSDDPWAVLINLCEVLENTPIEELYTQLNPIMDIDRTLWYLAQEIIFSDDDSYIFKGGMDYYVYWDEFTNRMMPLEVDGNSVMNNNYAEWSPFYHEEDDRFPLMFRMLQNTEIRQRYLAHMRTILNDYFLDEVIADRIDTFAELLDQRVQDDPKKIYSYPQFLNELDELKAYIRDRRDYLINHQEINREGLQVISVEDNLDEGGPSSTDQVQVKVAINEAAARVWLYYAEGVDGAFDRIEMLDDGQHQDEGAGDLIYGGSIPAFPSQTYVRYYIEVIKNDAFATAVYEPVGAEHDVFIYQVGNSVSPITDLVINEFMADNEAFVSDNNDDFDDWIEIYNKGSQMIDLSNFHLTDNGTDLSKWVFPENISLGGGEYLIIWADDDVEDQEEGELHGNFKLSASGEEIVFSDNNLLIIDAVNFGQQEEDKSFARIPNAVGDFVISTPTFGFENSNGTTSVEEEESFQREINISPNPSNQAIRIDIKDRSDASLSISIYNNSGVLVGQRTSVQVPVVVDVIDLPSGLYHLLIYDKDSFLGSQKVLIQH